MLHLGIDTVELNGQPFEMFVQENDTVKAGQKLATMDLQKVQASGKDTPIMTIITNSDAVKNMGDFEDKTVSAGDKALEIAVN